MGRVDRENSKTKILFLLEAFDKGGIEKVTLDIVNNLDPKKYDITVQTFWYGGYCQSQVNKNVEVIPFFFRKYVRGIIRLIQYLSPKLLYMLFVHGRYDIEIAASDGGAAKVISGSTNRKSKKICWVHMDVTARGSGLKEFRNAKTAQKIYKKFDMIACVSGACRDSFEKKFGYSYPVSIVYNPMNDVQIREKSLMPVDLSFFNGITFVCVGRLVEQKGFDRLLSACIRLKTENTYSFRVIVVGDGIEYDRLADSLKKSGLDDIVQFTGFKENPYPYIKNADVFLLTSRDESFSLVVGESLIIGTPVVATDCCGIEEWLGRDEMYGYIVENSTDGIYYGMKKVLENPKVLTFFRENILKRQNEIDFESSMRDFEQILKYEK